MLKKTTNKKQKTLLLSLVVIIALGAGVTIALILTHTDSVVNGFLPTKVTCSVEEKFGIGGKENVKIKNTGDIPAFIRAEVIVTWKNEAGDIYGKAPIQEIQGEKGDYTITYDFTNGWTLGSDGYYYYSEIVPAKESTKELITGANITDEANIPEGYYLNIEIIASAIQADGVSAGEPTGIAGKTPVELAWGVTVNDDGTISK